MKNNLISAIAGWKSAALLALVAMVAAVAFSGVLSTTQTAEAAAVPLTADESSADAAPGDTVQIDVKGTLAVLSITGTADGVGGSFVANDGQSITCSDGLTCDKNDNDDKIRVDLKIDADAGEGHILVSVEGLGAADNTEASTKVITVSKSTLVGSLALKATSKTIAANDDNINVGDGGANETTLTVNVKNAATTPAGLNSQSVTLVTTLGTISCDGTSYAQACSIDTADSSDTPGVDDGEAGWASVTLVGGAVEGKATITATLGSRSKKVDVTMYGNAKNLAATPQQDSIEISGTVYVVLKVTDAADNPVSGQVIVPVSAKEVVGPADDAVLVVTEKDTAATDESAVGVGYSKDFIHPTDKAKNIPACGDDNTGSEEVFTVDGTDENGECVVHVKAPEAATAATSATRGLHTLNFQISAAIKASATIEVAGVPNSISTDAPESVDPASVTAITVSVFDDDDVLVGITSVKVRKVGGDGLIEDQGDGGSEMTSNGQSKFTFIAPSNAGTAEILITAGKVDHRVTIIIGDPPEEAPDAPPATWNAPLASGTHNLVWNGDDGADVAAGAGEGVTAIWQWNGTGWDGYFPMAADVPGGNTLNSLSNNAPYWVIVE